VDQPGVIAFLLRHHHIRIAYTAASGRITIPCCGLTRVGKELYPITRTPDNVDIATAFAQQYPKNGVESIAYLANIPALNEQGVTLWTKPQEQQ
jgi:hypothetical protein